MTDATPTEQADPWPVSTPTPTDQPTPTDDGTPVRLTVELKSGSTSSWHVPAADAKKLGDLWLDPSNHRLWIATSKFTLVWASDEIEMIRIEAL